MTQKQFLLSYFQKNKHRWIPIYEFVQQWIYRYSARIFDLRKEWYKIEMKTKRVKHPKFQNQQHVWYKLVEQDPREVSLFI